MDKGVRILDRAVETALALLAGAMLLVVIAKVGLRWLLDAAPQEAFPSAQAALGAWDAPLFSASTILLTWVGFMGASLAVRRRRHLGIDALIRLYPPRLRLAMDRFATAVMAAFSLIVLVVGGFYVCEEAIQRKSMTPGLATFNRAWFYSILCISGLLNLTYCIWLFRHPRPVGSDAERQDEP